MKVFNDFNTTVEDAFDEVDPNWRSYNGLVICGTHTPKNKPIDVMLRQIKHAREDGTPFYGECFGYQLAVIEYARNVLGIKDATSEEFGEGTFVIKKLPELNVGLKDGESFWNNYKATITIPDIKNFYIAQYHASYQSRKGKPHKQITSFLRYAKMVS